jgi:hypothetical protein
MHEHVAWVTQAPPGTPTASCGRCPRHLGEPRGRDQIGQRDQPFTATRSLDDPDVDTSSSRRQRGTPGVPTFTRQAGSHGSRVRRAHIGLYCKRIFNKPGCPYDVPWMRPQALGILAPGQTREVIQGWVPPDLHYPGDSLLAVASKAPPQSSASSSAVLKSAAQNVSNCRPRMTPINVSDASDSEEHFPSQSVWNLLRRRSRSPRGRRDA